MALYTVANGDSIWDIADRSLGLQRGTNTPPATVQEVADEMLRIITLNMGKLKVPKGSKGTPGPADLIHAGLVLDLGGAPSPTEAAEKGKKQGGGSPTDPGGSAGADTSQKQGGGSPKDPGGSAGADNSRDIGEQREVRPVSPPRAGPGNEQREIRPVSPSRNLGNPTGGREPGWGGNLPQREVRPVSPPGRRPNPGAPTGGREPGWGGNLPQREVRPVSPPGRRPNPGAPTGGREPGWGGVSPRPARPNPGWGGREPAERPGRPRNR